MPKKSIAGEEPKKAVTTSSMTSRKRKGHELYNAGQKIPERSKRKRQKLSPVKPKLIFNQAPTQRLNVYVCGTGNAGELGLGTRIDAMEVERPRLNTNLDAATIGVTHLAVGGMHCAALTYDNRILTWGVNDQGALGRDTAWEGGMKDIDETSQKASSDASSDIDDTMNSREAVPTAIPEDSFPPGTIFVELAAGDSSTFALTTDGLVYGWGTFRNNEGVWAFNGSTKIQYKPSLVQGLKKIRHIACGDNHVLALDVNGRVYAWGSGQQGQLGRRILERLSKNALVPREFGLERRIKAIGCGSYHSFAISKDNKVFSFGLNNYGETGLEDQTRLQVQRDQDPTIDKPRVIQSLTGKDVICVTGGAHHSIAVTKSGECLVWGRLDGFQAGMSLESLPSDAFITDDRGKPRILPRPTPNPNIRGVVWAAAGSDHCLAITNEGRAWAWGFNVSSQTGTGGSDDVELARPIEAPAVRGQKFTWAGAGGQFSVLASFAP